MGKLPTSVKPEPKARDRAELGRNLVPLYAAEAKERQREAGARGKEGGRGKKKNPSGKNSLKGKPEPQARDRAAKAARSNTLQVRQRLKTIASWHLQVHFSEVHRE